MLTSGGALNGERVLCRGIEVGYHGPMLTVSKKNKSKGFSKRRWKYDICEEFMLEERVEAIQEKD